MVRAGAGYAGVAARPAAGASIQIVMTGAVAAWRLAGLKERPVPFGQTERGGVTAAVVFYLVHSVEPFTVQAIP